VQNDVKKLSDLIVNYLDKVGLFEQSKVLEVYASWASIVGEKQAAHSKLIDIKHQIALIEVDHPGWSQQILLNKKYILRNFQKKYPQLEVKNISVIVSSYYKPAHYFENTEKRDKVVADPVKTELPLEVQEAFERLKLSIVERK
jgi:uncharacterized protein TP_0004